MSAAHSRRFVGLLSDSADLRRRVGTDGVRPDSLIHSGFTPLTCPGQRFYRASGRITAACRRAQQSSRRWILSADIDLTRPQPCMAAGLAEWPPTRRTGGMCASPTRAPRPLCRPPPPGAGAPPLELRSPRRSLPGVSSGNARHPRVANGLPG